jgi:transcriptional regulator with XRE-family HTH domain
MSLIRPGLATDSEILQQLGQRLRRLRTERGLSAIEAASQAGIARRTIYRAERGLNPTLLTIVRLLRLYGRLEDLTNYAAQAPLSPMQVLRDRTSPTHG